MSLIEQQVQRARMRLNSSLVLDRLALGLVVAAAAISLAWIVDRALGLGVPTGALLGGAAGLAVLVAVVGWFVSRVDALRAAIAIDQAAGLKERLSTALLFQRSADPFAHAAVADAEKTARSVHVPTHLPLRASPLWSWAGAAVVVAFLLYAFMPQLNLLAAGQRDEPKPEEKGAVLAERKAVEVALSEQYTKVRKLAEANPELNDLAKDLEPLKAPTEPHQTPEDVRRDALKKIDKLSDKLAEKKDSDQFKALDEIKKRMAQLEPKQGNDPASRLTQALANGDTQAAKQQLAELKKQLEDAAQSGDEATKQKLLEMAEKLDDVAKQMEKLADQSKLQKELENKAGLSEEEAKKLLDDVAKMDPKQLEKELQKRLGEKGLDSKQIQELAKKLAQDKEAKKAMKQMAEKMQKAAQQCKKQCEGQQPGEGQNPGNQSGEGDALADAMDQMSEMEMTEQMMNELEAQMAELQDLREGMCQGRGRQSDQQGNQGPEAGIGYGARIGKESGAHGYKASKIRSRSNSGQIIGQMLIDGPQVKGEIGAEAKDAVTSAVRDASDAIERESIPRQYHEVTRRYFESLAGLGKGGARPPRTPTPAGKADTAEARRSDVEEKVGD